MPEEQSASPTTTLHTCQCNVQEPTKVFVQFSVVVQRELALLNRKTACQMTLNLNEGE